MTANELAHLAKAMDMIQAEVPAKESILFLRDAVAAICFHLAREKAHRYGQAFMPAAED